VPDVIDYPAPFALPPSCDNYLSTQLGYTLCGRSANATVSTGDECHSSGKFQIVSPSPTHRFSSSFIRRRVTYGRVEAEPRESDVHQQRRANPASPV
jgi:hypothetical protein